MRVLEMIFSAAGVMSVSYEVEKILTNYFDMITFFFQVMLTQEGKEKIRIGYSEISRWVS